MDGSFFDVKEGDEVLRLLAGTLPMKLKVVKVDEALIHTGGGWMFERVNGAEYDPDLCWGSAWGTTGSYLTKKDEA